MEERSGGGFGQLRIRAGPSIVGGHLDIGYVAAQKHDKHSRVCSRCSKDFLSFRLSED